MVKSANCAFSLEWIVERYRPRVLVQHRDPLNVVSSWMALGMDGDLPLEHPVVRERFLEVLGARGVPATRSRVARVTWTVGVLSLGLKMAAERHPDWTVVFYDELCRHPELGFIGLFEALGLPWTEDAAAYLNVADHPDYVDPHRNPRAAAGERTMTPGCASLRSQQATQFRRLLSKQQIEEARAVLADLPLGDWGPHDL